ncbi:MAG: ABC transporter substrate-binding protein [Candidatus Schekmanbacteria bacterium]|nr:ABC transporter substrate-binding protein [Candidatus Schekmanbacteria bacterium]
MTPFAGTARCSPRLAVALAWGVWALAAGSILAAEARPQRIISMAPNITELLFAVGAGDRVVGVTEFCGYPPEARKRAKVGGYLNPNLEIITALRPDLVVAYREHEVLNQHCKRIGVPVLSLTMLSLEDVFRNIALVAEAVGHPEAGRALASSIQADLDAVRGQAAALRPPRTLLLLGPLATDGTHPMAVGNGSFLADLLVLAGAANVFADVARPYFYPSTEEILARQPEVILETVLEVEPIAAAGDRRDTDQDVHLTWTVSPAWAKLAGLPAVRDGRIVRLDGKQLHSPGPRVGAVARALVRAVHGGERAAAAAGSRR